MTDKEIQAELNKDSQKFYNVRFEGELPKDIIHLFGLAIFYVAPSVHQIQAVKIKEILSKTKEELLVGEVGNFNSSMVRLKAKKQKSKMIKYFNFNSSMVRLKVRVCELKQNGTIISIPLWCD